MCTNSDPTLKSGRREAIIVFVVWGVALIYSVSYCYWFGYHPTLANPRFVFGIPHWVFWGVVMPWLVCLVFAWWFSFFLIEDDQLPPDAEGIDGLNDARGGG